MKIRVKPSAKLRLIMFKRAGIAVLLVALGAFLLMVSEDKCRQFVFPSWCSIMGKEHILSLFFSVDVLLLLYVMGPFVHLSSIRFLLQSKNPKK